MTVIIPIVATIVGLLAVFFLWWISYPFLLRYTIETRLPSSKLTNASNGNNGENGLNGEHSPDPRHGIHGQPGQGSAGGAHGNNGISGRQGEVGITGDDGGHGEDGEDGEDGIPGYSVITVKEDIFDPASKTVYYVNGVPLDEHSVNAAGKITDQFETEKTRIKQLIETTLKSTDDKNFFKTKVDLLNPNLITPDVSIYVLDTIGKLNNFLIDFKTTSLAQANLEADAKNTARLDIDAANKIIDDLRKKRALDYANLETTVFKLSVRLDVNNGIRTANPGLLPSFEAILVDLETNISSTYDSHIRELTVLLTQQNRIYTSTSSSSAAKNAALLEINSLTSQINLLKHGKEEVNYRESVDKALILERYANGDLSGSNPYGLVLQTYGTGANVQKAIITAARNAVLTADTVRKTAMETFIGLYRP